MADLTNVELALNEGEEITFSNGAATQTFDFNVPDEKLVVLIRNDDSNTATVAFEAGDFFQEGYGDVSAAVEENEYFAFVFDSAVIKDEDSEVTVTVKDSDGSSFSGSEADVKIAVLEL